MIISIACTPTTISPLEKHAKCWASCGRHLNPACIKQMPALSGAIRTCWKVHARSWYKQGFHRCFGLMPHGVTATTATVLCAKTGPQHGSEGIGPTFRANSSRWVVAHSSCPPVDGHRSVRQTRKWCGEFSWAIVLHPGGRWNGDYLVMELTEFVDQSLKVDADSYDYRATPHVTKQVRLGANGIVFPLKARYDQANLTLDGAQCRV